MKRVALFLLTNLGVMLVLGLAVNVLGLNHFLTANGLSLTGLLGFALVMGFSGALISLYDQQAHGQVDHQAAGDQWLA